MRIVSGQRSDLQERGAGTPVAQPDPSAFAEVADDAALVTFQNRSALLASALAGKRLTVGRSEGAAYTNGETIFLPAGEGDERARLVLLGVHACLVGGDSLRPAIMALLVGQRRAALRYFSLEIARSSIAMQSRLPRSLARVLEAHRIEAIPASPEESLERAMGRESIPLPPEGFGSLRPKEVLRGASLGRSSPPTADDLNGTALQVAVPELEDEDESSDSTLLKLLSSPVAPAPLMKFLQHLFGAGRRSRGDSPSGGAEVPVSGAMAVTQVGSQAQLLPNCPDLKIDRPATRVDGVYPEWDCEARRYRHEWCWVTEYDPPQGSSEQWAGSARDPDLRKRLARLGLSFQRHRRQGEGEALDLDPLVELLVQRAMGESGSERVYQSRRKTAHDLGVVLLLDASGSTAERHRGQHRAYDEQRRVACNLAVALEEIGDRVALFGFSSQGRQAVRFQRVKDFDDRFDHSALRRLGNLEPSGFTRLGAAVRHGLHLVTKKSGATNRLLVLISDGLPFDDSYEGTYGERDTRQALAEARYNGVGTVCLSFAPSTRAAALERVFGSSAYVRLQQASDLNELIEAPLRSALRVAGSTQRRVKRYEPAVHAPAGCGPKG